MTGADFCEARERLGLSTLEVSRILLVNFSTVYRWERQGDIRAEPVQRLALMKLFGLSVQRLALTHGAQLRKAIDEAPGYALHVLLALAFDDWRTADAS